MNQLDPMSVRALHAVVLVISLVGSMSVKAELRVVTAHPVSPAVLVAARAASDESRLLLRQAIFDPQLETVQAAGWALAEPAPDYGIVQFEPGLAGTAELLLDHGYEVLAHQPQNAWLVRWSGAQRKQATRLPGVRWAGDFSAAMKLAPELLDPAALALDPVRLPDGALSAPGMTLELLGFSGVNPADLAAAVRKFEPTAELLELKSGPRWPAAVIWLPGERLQAAVERFTAIAGVYQIAPARPLQLLNTDSVETIQANTDSGTPLPSVTPLWNQGLIGTGQIVAVMDSGLDRNEDWFVGLDRGTGVNIELTDAESPVPPAIGTTYPDRKVYAYWVQPGATAYDNNEICTTSPTSFHGTHTTGSVAGDSLTRSSPTDPGYDAADGMAPNAQILFQDVGNDISGCLSITNLFASLEQAAAGGASIHSNSWGADARGAYTANSAAVDALTWQQQSMLVTFSAGNSGPGVDTIGAPATAKNALTVGALNHGNSTTVVGFSSRGPTDDGRTKPDIQAPGVSIVSAAGDTNNNPTPEPPSTRTLSGTSMSNPTVAGGAALARQYFTDGFYPGGTRNAADSDIPSGALVKAMLLNGTRADASFNIPSNNYGWGRIWLDNNLYFNGDGRYFRHWDVAHDAGLAQGESGIFEVDLSAGQEFRATLTWFDVAGAVGSGVTLVNDLDLEVTAPGGQVYRGNVFAAGSQSITGGSFDRINSVEQVRLTAPAAGSYTVRVIAAAVPGNGEPFSDRQGYALVVSAAAATPPALAAPAAASASDQGGAGIALSIPVVAGASGYNIYRAIGDCSVESLDFGWVGHSSGGSFTDTRVIGGFSYSYRVRAEDGSSEGPISSCTAASVATSSAACTLRPRFDQSGVAVEDRPGDACGIDLNWDPGEALCPLGNPLRYNIYRSTDPFFEPGPATRLLGDYGSTALTDFTVQPGTTYYYVVRAEDGTDPTDGNESSGSRRVQAAPLGDGNVPGTFTDGADGLALMRTDSIWSITDERAATGTLSYRSAVRGAAVYTTNTCAAITTPPIELQPGTPQLDFMARYDIEADWDGVVLEISNDGGTGWVPVTPIGGYPGDFSQTQNPPINACGYPISQGAFNGSTGGSFQSFSANLSAFAGQTVQLRWVLSTDPGSEEEGFYLDSIEISDASMPAACSVTDELFEDGFEDPAP